MALRPEHELHRRRRGRNTGILVVLLLFVALIFGMSIVKITNGHMMEGFDHQPRPSLLPPEEGPVSSSTDQAAPVSGEEEGS